MTSSQEPEFDDSVKCCPDCGKPNQFGELCLKCAREHDIEGQPQDDV